MSDIERKHTGSRMSKIVCHGGLIFLAGQTANGSAAAHEDLSAQVRESLSRVDALLTDAGTDRSRILSATIYLKNISGFDTMNRIWESWVFPDSTPARTTVEASLGSPNILFEITVIAAST